MKSKLLILFSVILFCFQSCDDDGYALGDIAIDMATVVVHENGYSFTADNWGTLFPASSSIPWYTPADSQRVIVYFNPLQDDFQGYDCAIKVERIEEILTKKIETITLENDSEYGNDKIVIEDGDIWISNGYLNIQFYQNLPQSQKHRISLVRREPDTSTDGYVHLELRYNDYDDLSSYWAHGLVSFVLNEHTQNPDIKGYKIIANLQSKGYTEFVYDLNQETAPTLKSIDYSTKDME